MSCNGGWTPMEDDLQLKATYNIWNGITNEPFKLKLRWPKQNYKKLLQMITTSNGRRPQNIKSGITQQPLIGSHSDFKLKLKDCLELIMTLSERL